MLFREAIHECEPPARDERFRNRLAAVLLKVGFVVKQLELAGTAGHEEVNHALGPGRKVARPGSERVTLTRGGRFTAGRSSCRGKAESSLAKTGDRPPEATKERLPRAPRRSRRRNGAAFANARRGQAFLAGVDLRPCRCPSVSKTDHSRVTNSSRFNRTRATESQC